MKLQVGEGIDNYVDMLGNLEFHADDMIGEAIYQGAKIVADEVKKNIAQIPVDNRVWVEEGSKRTGLRSIQIQGLKESFGIAHKRNDYGYINVKVGFDGYNNLRTNEYPSGQPNAMIARTIESGNSFTQKHPFVTPAVRASKERAELAMQQVIDTAISKIMKD